MSRPGPKRGYRQSPEHAAKRAAARRFWTSARLWQVAEMAERGWSDERIGAALGVTANAVCMARKRNGLVSGKRAFLSARQVGAMMGVESKAVAVWIERGMLRGRHGTVWGPRPMWWVTYDDLLAFVEAEAHWHTWRPERISDDSLRAYALRLRGDVRFLTVGEVAWRMCVQPGTVNRWIHEGRLPARKWGNWWVRESDLDGFELPVIGGQRWRKAA